MQPVNLADFELAARAKMDAGAYDYFAGGANDELSLAENLEAFRRLRLRPRVLVGSQTQDLTMTLLGERLALPVIVAPMAYQGLAHPAAECATAAGASAVGSLFTMATLANASFADVATAAMGRFWFQLYVFRDRAASLELVQAAERAGAKALVVTVDAPQLGRRERDVRRSFALPHGMRLANLRAEDQALLVAATAGSSVEAHARSLFDPALTWADLAWFAAASTLPVLVKGVLRGDDAQRAVDAGAAGVIVSNHGGRQLDGAVAAIDALPEVVRAVGSRGVVLVDGGVRRGTDVLKALALGARAVLLGRPVLWGLAAAGQDGVQQVLTLLREELSLAMALAGCARLSDITPDLVVD